MSNDCGCIRGTEESKNHHDAAGAVDLSKARPGDRVKFRCGGEETIKGIVTTHSGAKNMKFSVDQRTWDTWELHGEKQLGARHFDIIAIEPAPFDWATAKPGMAFYFSIRAEIVHYVGPDTLTKHVFKHPNGSFRSWFASNGANGGFTRLPEDDRNPSA